jgi:hypothetical protein
MMQITLKLSKKVKSTIRKNVITTTAHATITTVEIREIYFMTKNEIQSVEN